jgi:hypothetical protein
MGMKRSGDGKENIGTAVFGFQEAEVDLDPRKKTT